MLQGLCRCSAGGATLCMAVNHTSLQCYSYTHGRCQTSHSITLKKINALVIASLEKILSDDSTKIEINHRKKQNNENIPAMIEREKKKLRRVREAYENEAYTLEEYKESKLSIQNRINELSNKLAVIPFDDQTDRKKLTGRIAAILPSLKSPAVPEDFKNSLLKSFVERIVFYRSRCDIDIFFYV